MWGLALRSLVILSLDRVISVARWYPIVWRLIADREVRSDHPECRALMSCLSSLNGRVMPVLSIR